MGRWGVGWHTGLSYRLDLTEPSSNGPLSTTNCIRLHPILDTRCPDFSLPPHTLPPPFVAFYDTTTTLPLCLPIRCLPRNQLWTECPGCREGKHLQTRWRDGPCKGTRLPRHARVLLSRTITTLTLPSLHNNPCQSVYLTFALGNLCNAHLQSQPHASRMYLATTRVTSSRARCQRSGPAPTLRDLARRPIRSSQAGDGLPLCNPSSSTPLR